MGIHLGDMGQVHEDLDISFGWFGATVRAHPKLSSSIQVEYMEKASKVDENSPEALSFVKNYLRSYIHPDDFETFWTLALENRQEVPDLQRLQKALMEAAMGRPTGPASDSSTSTATEKPSTPDGLHSRVMSSLDGRPDLQNCVQKAISDQKDKATATS